MQESKQEPRFTIFARWNDNSYRQGKECFFPPLAGEPKSLADRIEYVRNFIGPDNFIPFAWTCSTSFGFLGFEEETVASVAAGRLIEQVDGKWIARGLDLALSTAHVCDVPDGLTVTPADLAMIAKDGPAKPAPAFIAPAPLITTKPPIAGLTRVSAQDHRVGGWGFVR